jgi:membrane associated rhomboid family serine protease
MTLYIVIITCIISIIAFQSRDLMDRLIFNPYKVHKYGQWYRLLTSGFIHADWMHLIFNMYVCYNFGRIVEQEYDIAFEEKGWYYFLLLYIGGIIGSILPTYKKHKDNYSYNALGASGAVSAIVFVFILFEPTAKLALLFFPIPLPAWIFGLLYIAFEIYMDKRGSSNINHNAHFWGAMFGIVFTLCLKPLLITEFFQKVVGMFQ